MSAPLTKVKPSLMSFDQSSLTYHNQLKSRNVAQRRRRIDGRQLGNWARFTMSHRGINGYLFISYTF
jgi:hypothetical protein